MDASSQIFHFCRLEEDLCMCAQARKFAWKCSLLFPASHMHMKRRKQLSLKGGGSAGMSIGWMCSRMHLECLFWRWSSWMQHWQESSNDKNLSIHLSWLKLWKPTDLNAVQNQCLLNGKIQNWNGGFFLWYFCQFAFVSDAYFKQIDVLNPSSIRMNRIYLLCCTHT